MRVLMVPLIVMSAVAGDLYEEPNEAQMKGAFEQTLLRQVRNAVDFAAENGGPEAVQAIRQNGTDRFELRAFAKRACARVTGVRAYRCDFTVDITLVDGSLQHALTGRFFNGAAGLTFAQEEPHERLQAVTSIL